jgi:colanic acid/amylovoran biosynthesis protein
MGGKLGPYPIDKRSPQFSAFAVSRTGNRGAVSMLESAIDHLTAQEPNGEVNVFSVYPEVDQKLPPTAGVRLYDGTPKNLAFKIIPLCIFYRLAKVLGIKVDEHKLGPEMEALLATDVCLMIGGTTFSDAQPVKIIYNALCLLPAILLGKKAMMYSQTLGPFNTWYNRVIAGWCLSKMDFIAPRGPGSLKNVESLHLKVPVSYQADAAFTLVVPTEIQTRIRQKYQPLFAGRTVVGISVNSIVEGECKKLGIDHNAIWAQFIAYLQNQGFAILLIPHSMRPEGKSRHNNDLLVVADILDRLPSRDGIILADEPYDCKELRVVVGLANYYVASRFHSMISALCCGVPVAVFGWGFQKYREVMQEFQLEQYCYDAADLSFDQLVASFMRIQQDAVEIKARISENMPRIRRSSALNHEMAWSLFKG